jgi:hypothetical protein
MSDNQNRSSQRPQHPLTSGDTMTPAAASRYDREPVRGTSRDDMRRDTQRPDRAMVDALNSR